MSENCPHKWQHRPHKWQRRSHKWQHRPHKWQCGQLKEGGRLTLMRSETWPEIARAGVSTRGEINWKRAHVRYKAYCAGGGSDLISRNSRQRRLKGIAACASYSLCTANSHARNRIAGTNCSEMRFLVVEFGVLGRGAEWS
eukprot:883834-Rhodomonas_salina.1